jgi:hypothetical protein
MNKSFKRVLKNEMTTVIIVIILLSTTTRSAAKHVMKILRFSRKQRISRTSAAAAAVGREQKTIIIVGYVYYYHFRKLLPNNISTRTRGLFHHKAVSFSTRILPVRHHLGKNEQKKKPNSVNEERPTDHA